MSKSVILTGIRANADLHIGNYFGALLPIIDMANERSSDYDINLFVADLHSFLTPIDHTLLNDTIFDNLRSFVAAGLPLDNKNIYVYRQSYIPAHSELTWILDCFTGVGEMERMIQFKEKSAKLHNDRINVGLFNYPVLQAADILLYNSKYVPVGEDQTQHLEFARDIALRFNTKFGKVFTIPESAKKQHEFFGKEQGLRIKDLQDPCKKMSKSDETGKGVIFLTDSPEVAVKKIMSATTDSIGSINRDYTNQPGIANLLDIYNLLGGNPDDFISQKQYGPFKKAVADYVHKFLTDFQASVLNVSDSALNNKLAQSEKLMNSIANATLLRAQKAVGLR